MVKRAYRLSWLLAGVVLAGMLTGCDGNKEEDSTEYTEIVNMETESEVESETGTEDLVTESLDTENLDTEEPEEKEYEKITSDASILNHETVVVVDKSAYELFTYRDETAESYAAAVNELGKSLGDKTPIYDILVPLSSGVVFPDNLRDQITSTDQQAAMQKIFAKIDDSVKKVDIYDSLMSHRTEYIYFRTDHHWTALGAYYAYEDFCEAKGIEAEGLTDYEIKEFDGFVGSFYNDTSEKVLKDNPDTIIAYEPKCSSSVHVTASDGSEYDWWVIHDVSDYAADIKYSTFVAGDNPLTVIENKDIDEGESCVVIKESFGNAFIPFLVDHYKTIYVIDYRYYSGNVSEFVSENSVDDVILINNLSMLRNQYLVGQFQKVVK